MSTPSLIPPDPWLSGPGAAAIGPVESVHGPSATTVRLQHLLDGMVVALFLPAWLTPVVAVAVGLGRGETPAATVAAVAVLLATLFLVVVVRDLRRHARRELATRLLVGARGVARWSPTEEVVVLWDDLGTVWVCVPATDPTGIWLRRADGVTVAVDDWFADHEPVASRVLDAVAQLLDRRPSGARPDRHSEAIRPDEPGIAEPRP